VEIGCGTRQATVLLDAGRRRVGAPPTDGVFASIEDESRPRLIVVAYRRPHFAHSESALLAANGTMPADRHP
jgi:hypothetical protein